MIFYIYLFIFNISPIKNNNKLQQKCLLIGIFCMDRKNQSKPDFASGFFVDYCKKQGVLEVNVIKVLWGEGKAYCLMSEKLLSFLMLFLIMLNM